MGVVDRAHRRASVLFAVLTLLSLFAAAGPSALAEPGQGGGGPPEGAGGGNGNGGGAAGGGNGNGGGAGPGAGGEGGAGGQGNAAQAGGGNGHGGGAGAGGNGGGAPSGAGAESSGSSGAGPGGDGGHGNAGGNGGAPSGSDAGAPQGNGGSPGHGGGAPESNPGQGHGNGGASSSGGAPESNPGQGHGNGGASSSGGGAPPAGHDPSNGRGPGAGRPAPDSEQTDADPSGHGRKPVFATNASLPEGTPDVPGPTDEGAVKEHRKPPVVKVNHDLTQTLRVERRGNDHTLRWTPTDHETRGYQVWRSNSPFTLVATLPGDATEFVDAGAPLNSKYKVTFYTDETVEAGYVPPSAEPATLPEWNPDAYVAASALAPVVVKQAPAGWIVWFAIVETCLIVAGVTYAISRPERSARALVQARSGVVRGSAQFTLSVILFGEAVERFLRIRVLRRFTDRQLLELFEFMMAPEAAPPPEEALPEPAPMPRLTVDRLKVPDLAEA